MVTGYEYSISLIRHEKNVYKINMTSGPFKYNYKIKNRITVRQLGYIDPLFFARPQFLLQLQNEKTH